MADRRRPAPHRSDALSYKQVDGDRHKISRLALAELTCLIAVEPRRTGRNNLGPHPTVTGIDSSLGITAALGISAPPANPVRLAGVIEGVP